MRKEQHNVTCHYRIVGCGYRGLYLGRQQAGRNGAAKNQFGVDLSSNRAPETAAWYAPSMYNIVKRGGRDVHPGDQKPGRPARGELGPRLGAGRHG